MELTVNTGTLCLIFGVTRPTVGKWVKDGMPKMGRGMFDVPAAVQWQMDRVRGDTPDTEEARRRLYVAQESHKVLETEILRGTVIRSDDVAHFNTALAGEYVAAIDSLPPRLGSELAGIADPAQCEEVIERECRGIRADLERKLGQFGERLNASHADNQPAPKAPRGRLGGRKPNTARSAGAGTLAQ